MSQATATARSCCIAGSAASRPASGPRSWRWSMASRQATPGNDGNCWSGRRASTMSSDTSDAASALQCSNGRPPASGRGLVLAQPPAESAGEDHDRKHFTHSLSLGCGLEASRGSRVKPAIA